MSRETARRGPVVDARGEDRPTRGRAARTVLGIVLAALALAACGGSAPGSPALSPSAITEDGPGWDCRTMGNRICGTPTAPATPTFDCHKYNSCGSQGTIEVDPDPVDPDQPFCFAEEDIKGTVHSWLLESRLNGERYRFAPGKAKRLADAYPESSNLGWRVIGYCYKEPNA